MRQTIFTTESSNYSYSDYLEYCELNDFTAGSEDSMEYWEYVSDMIREDIDDAFYGMNSSPDANTTVVITGTLGLWNGHPTIKPVFVESDMVYHNKVRSYNSALVLAIKKCIGKCDDVECYFNTEKGCVEVIGHHHDGTNNFEIWKLSKFGKEEKVNSEDEDYEVTQEWLEPFKEEDFF